MPAPNWTIVRNEFTEIYTLAEPERAARLTSLDPEVRAEVESLLAALDQRPDFLEPSKAAPSSIGPYHLIEEIGRGGMGTVYRAERSDGEFQQTVAVKLIGGQMFAPEATRRFIAERQILARLEHPNIVRLLDGGIFEGVRYFVMEFVQGEPVTKHCVDRNLTVNQRLKLFASICDAIQYAHRQLVIHRDLKSQNIIVAAEGVPKVLDFGIAQICTPESGVNTMTGMRPLSYACASPEQIRGEALTASSDIYSLGVLLYELLTGENPQMPSGASTADAFHRIVEQELPTLRSSAELNAVIQRATAKNPSERYSSAAELGAEVTRVVQGEPVSALATHRWYVFRKFARRNRTALAAASVLAISLAVAAILFARQARIEARRFESARGFANRVIFQLQTERSEAAGLLQTRATLTEGALQYLESISSEIGDNGPLLREVTGAYLALARAQATDPRSLGKRSDAAESLRQGERLLLRGLAQDPSDPGLIRVAVRLYMTAANFYTTSLDLPAARANIAKADSFLQELKELAPREFSTRYLEAAVLAERGTVEARSDEREALVYLQQSLKLYQELLAEAPSDQALVRDTIDLRARIAETYISLGDSGNAFEHAGKALAMCDVALGRSPSDRRLQIAMSNILVLLTRANGLVNKFQESLALSERALRMREAILATDPAAIGLKERVAEAARLVAIGNVRTGHFDQAAKAANAVLKMLSDLEAQHSMSPVWMILRADSHQTLAEVALERGNMQEFCREGRRGLAAYDWVLSRTPNRKAAKRTRDKLQGLMANCPAQ